MTFKIVEKVNQLISNLCHHSVADVEYLIRRMHFV